MKENREFVWMVLYSWNVFNYLKLSDKKRSKTIVLRVEQIIVIES